MAYATSATTKGGRNGRAMLDDGALALAMALPKELGGAGDGHNPEQLFALGYSACFGQAILVVAKKHGIDGQAAANGGCRLGNRIFVVHARRGEVRARGNADRIDV